MQIIPETLDFGQYLSEVSPTEEVVPASSFLPDVIEKLFSVGGKHCATLPWSKLHQKFDLRPGEVTLWAGTNGSGKSLITTQLAGHLMLTGHKVGIASMEMLPASTIARMARVIGGSANLTEAYVRHFVRWAGRSCWLLDVQHSVRGKRVLDAIRFVSEHCGVTHFFVDSLMKCVRNEDDYNGQKEFIESLCRIAMDLRTMHVHLIAHTRKGENEYAMPDKFDIKGSGSIADQVDNIVLVWRNKRKEDQLQDPKLDALKRAEAERIPDAVLLVKKQRHYEWEGKAGLFLHRDSMSFLDSFGSKHPIPDIGFVADADGLDYDAVPF